MKKKKMDSCSYDRFFIDVSYHVAAYNIENYARQLAEKNLYPLTTC